MKIVKTHIVCLDDHKTFSEEVRNRFSDAEKYIVKITHNREDLMRALNNGKETDIFRIVIMGLSDSRENIEYTDSIISDIKEYNPETAILLITPQDKTEDIRNSMKSKADTFDNFFLLVYKNLSVNITCFYIQGEKSYQPLYWLHLSQLHCCSSFYRVS